MSANRPNKKKSTQSKSQPKSSALWSNLSEKQEEQTNGGYFPYDGGRASYNGGCYYY